MHPIELKPVLISDRKVAPPTRVAAPQPADKVGAQDQVASTTPQLAQALSAGPPIDHDRVSRIRKAIANGTFPIYPAQIADRLIAFKLEWNPDEPR